jgi:hypothetical protein
MCVFIAVRLFDSYGGGDTYFEAENAMPDAKSINTIGFERDDVSQDRLGNQP